jgi:hypothetical protein
VSGQCYVSQCCLFVFKNINISVSRSCYPFWDLLFLSSYHSFSFATDGLFPSPQSQSILNHGTFVARIPNCQSAEYDRELFPMWLFQTMINESLVEILRGAGQLALGRFPKLTYLHLELVFQPACA